MANSRKNIKDTTKHPQSASNHTQSEGDEQAPLSNEEQIEQHQKATRRSRYFQLASLPFMMIGGIVVIAGVVASVLFPPVTLLMTIGAIMIGIFISAIGGGIFAKGEATVQGHYDKIADIKKQEREGEKATTANLDPSVQANANVVTQQEVQNEQESAHELSAEEIASRVSQEELGHLSTNEINLGRTHNDPTMNSSNIAPNTPQIEQDKEKNKEEQQDEAMHKKSTPVAHQK